MDETFMNPTVPSIEEILHELVDLQRRRGEEYGETYLSKGELDAVLFPDGITIQTVWEHRVYSLIIMIEHKLMRLCENPFLPGRNDSVADMAVYCCILQRVLLLWEAEMYAKAREALYADGDVRPAFVDDEVPYKVTTEEEPNNEQNKS